MWPTSNSESRLGLPISAILKMSFFRELGRAFGEIVTPFQRKTLVAVAAAAVWTMAFRNGEELGRIQSRREGESRRAALEAQRAEDLAAVQAMKSSKKPDFI